MKPLLEYLPVPEVCLTWSCGNPGDHRTGFCHSCLPPLPREGVIKRAFRSITNWIFEIES